MPVYEYECECGHIFEETHSIKEDSSTSKCPKCSKKARKVPSLVDFHLKGGGWAKDGYSKGG